jgi:vesicle-fusing ATPase
MEPFDFKSRGIGGLENQFKTLVERIFLLRTLPPAMRNALKMQPVRGVLLYGPPGTGKTLIARELGKALGAKREPKIIQGPEVLNRYVGGSADNMRSYFADAIKEYKEKGDSSDLHLIIFDEIDSWCKKRGSANDSGASDQVVNQFLTLLDGLGSLNNVLVIGTTNRIDLIDDAAKRPGRLEVHLEISLPDEKGRKEILEIHTAGLRNTPNINLTFDLQDIASRAKNFSGAELEAVVRLATSKALYDQTDINHLEKLPDWIKEPITISQEHFLRALQGITPTFGAAGVKIPGSVLPYPSYSRALQAADAILGQFASNNLPTETMLIEGLPGSGKTTLALKVCLKHNYCKVFNAMQFQESSEFGKISALKNAYLDARKVGGALVLDDLDSLVSYCEVANSVTCDRRSLMAIYDLLRDSSVEGKKVLFIATTANAEKFRQRFAENLSEYFDEENIIKTSFLSDEDLAFLDGKAYAEESTSSDAIQLTIKKYLKRGKQPSSIPH